MNMLLEPWHWFVLGIVLITVEFFITAFVILWFGIAAIMVSILLLTFPEISFLTQIISWIALSLVTMVLWFKLIKPLSKNHISKASAIGQIGLVIQCNIEHHIQVRFPKPISGSDEWFCRCSQSVKVGDQVKVIDVIENTFIIEPILTHQ